MSGSTSTPTRAITIMYALGWNATLRRAQIIRCGAIMQLLLGNIGCVRRRHERARNSNIQGLTDLGLMSNLLPGYLTLRR